MKFLRKLILWLLIALLVVIIAAYFLLQTQWGGRQASAWLSDGTGWKVSFNKMDHNFSSPLHLQLQNVTLGRDGKPATLVAQTVDIGFSSRQFSDPLHADEIVLSDGTLNFSPSSAALPFAADRLQLRNMAFNSPESDWDLSAQRVTGGVSPWAPEAGNVLGKKTQIQMSAGSMTLNGIEASNVLIQGNIDNGEVSLSTIGADVARGTLTGTAKRSADGGWQVDNLMTAATQARERLLADNAKKKAQINELQSFVSRFSANASKSKQATSRARQIDKIQLEEVKASSRQNPFIRFDQDKKLFRNALEVEALTKGFDNGPLFSKLNLMVEVGEKVAVLGANGIGKTTLLKTLVGDAQPDSGTVKWSENARIGYYAQDHEYEFDDTLTVFDWMSQWKQEKDDEQAVRSVLGRLLFSQDDIKKKVKVLSGGEKGRMLFGKLMMQRPNILVMDEPTNHLDMESIESLNMALEMYEGTLIFVSHDREFVSSLATRILEITPNKVIDFTGNYEDYLRSQGIV